MVLVSNSLWCIFQSFSELEAFNKPSRPFLSLQFQFVNSYLSLFYIGFYLKDMERLKEVSNISLSALWIFFSHHSFVSVTHSASDIRHGCKSPVLTPFALSAYMHWLCKPPIHTPPLCSCEEDAAGLVSVTESAEAGPRQFAALPLLQDPDACSLCSLVLHSVTQIQSMTHGPHSSFWINRENVYRWATTAVTLHAL